ncbi:MAG TPA: 50S ribosomal protein L25 [Candidatus Kapabacteria bacterium]|nr:50S ribosomal protein L25 [Candidatus Kapabacteria bacterium]
MKSVSLNAFPRELNKRLGVKKVRTNGRIPAVIYGRHNKPQNLEVASKDLEQVIHTAHSEILLVNLAVDKGNRLALVREIQHHPLSGKMLHVDFQEVAENEKVTAMVPVETIGEAAGVKTGGGVLEHVLFKVKVRATPKDLPDVINVDVSSLEIGKSIHIGDITVPQGVEIIGKKETPVVSVAAPLTEAQEAAATEAAGGSPAQPEMLKEKKEEGAPAAGGKPAAGGDKAAAGGDKKPAEKKK